MLRHSLLSARASHKRKVTSMKGVLMVCCVQFYTGELIPFHHFPFSQTVSSDLACISVRAIEGGGVFPAASDGQCHRPGSRIAELLLRPGERAAGGVDGYCTVGLVDRALGNRPDWGCINDISDISGIHVLIFRKYYVPCYL